MSTTGRPRSLFERYTRSNVPPPDQQIQTVLVTEGMNLFALANQYYNQQEYDPTGWRLIATANGVENPFTFGKRGHDDNFVGKTLVIPPKPLPNFRD